MGRRHPTIIPATGEGGLNERYVAVAAEAVLKAGALQRARYGQAMEVSHKGEIDLVTEVDRACEDLVLATLRSRFPGHDIVTEESDLARTGASHVWYVDPIDGTTNFAHAYPFFCCSVGLAIDGRPVAGAVYDPLREELFTGERGGGAFLNGRPLRVSKASDLLSSLLCTGFPYDLREDPVTKLRLFNRFMRHAQGIRRDGAAALDLSYLAAGRIDGFWEERLQPWDMIAGIVLVEEAGGRVSRFDGAPTGVVADELLATNGPLHDAMLRVLQDEREGAA
jgi:myo-inositol-1(or 4)-monophosphatase